MPEEFDPAWEYWQPDPEIEWAMGAVQLGAFDDLGVENREENCLQDLGRRYRPGAFNPGFRYDRGDPDRVLIDPEPEPPVFHSPVAPREVRLRCRRCDRPFTTTGCRNHEHRRVWCRECLPGRGRPAVKPTVCVGCGCDFVPSQRRHFRYCSPSCGGRAETAEEYHRHGCPVCGAAVVPSGRGRSSAKLFCTRRCMGVARRRTYNRKGSPMKLEDAKLAIRRGVAFDVAGDGLSPVELEVLKAWYVREPSVPNTGARRPKPVPEVSSDLCPRCGGFMVRTGTCLTCQSCGESSGGCG